MKGKSLKILLVSTIVGCLILGTASAALAGPPDVVDGVDPVSAFLCPAAGKCVLNHHPAAPRIASGQYTFLPGHNQTGVHTNPRAVTLDSPADTDGPGGGNGDWSPIWPTPPS